MNAQSQDKPVVFDGIKLVAFDLDGTLIDAFADIAAAANYVRRQNTLPELSVDEVKKHVGRGARYLVRNVLGTDDESVIDRNYAALVDYFKSASETHATFYDGVLHSLQELRGRGIKTAVITNKPDEVTHKLIRKMGAYDSFDIIQGESSRFAHKPSPETLIHVMEQAGVSRDETLMVGDTTVDIEFARAAGVKVVVVTYGQMSEAELMSHKPDAVIHAMAQLNAMIV